MDNISIFCHWCHKFVDQGKACISYPRNPNSLDDDRKHIKHCSNNNFQFHYKHIFYIWYHKPDHQNNFYTSHFINIDQHHIMNKLHWQHTLRFYWYKHKSVALQCKFYRNHSQLSRMFWPVDHIQNRLDNSNITKWQGYNILVVNNWYNQFFQDMVYSMDTCMFDLYIFGWKNTYKCYFHRRHSYHLGKQNISMSIDRSNHLALHSFGILLQHIMVIMLDIGIYQF